MQVQVLNVHVFEYLRAVANSLLYLNKNKTMNYERGIDLDWGHVWIHKSVFVLQSGVASGVRQPLRV